jgi:hypothetical protein
MWTRFYDMASGGRSKLDWDVINIELPKEKAIKAFENIFGRNPHSVTCTCCGPDCSITQYADREALERSSPTWGRSKVRHIDKAELKELLTSWFYDE